MVFIKKIPLPISGLALGLAALGLNLEVALAAEFGQFIPAVKAVCGILAGLVVILVLARIAFDWEGVKKEFGNVVVRSVFPTFFMACMILATYLKPYIGQAAFFIWAAALILQFAWVIAFIVQFVFLKFDVKNIFPSWFLVFVGFVVGATTSPAFDMGVVGEYVWYAGLVGYVIALVFVGYRFIGNRELPAPAKPTMAITLAPANLLLAGHLALVKAEVLTPMFPLIYTLLAFSAISLVIVVVYCAPIAFGQFFPSFSAFTFPFVIASIAITNLSLKLMPWLAPVAIVLQALAVFMVVYVLVRYSLFLATPKKSA